MLVFTLIAVYFFIVIFIFSIFRPAPKIPNSSESSSKAIQDAESISESDDDQKHLQIGSEKSDTGSLHSKGSPEVDEEGYTIRPPERKKSVSSSDSSSWESDDNGKIDTYKFKVNLSKTFITYIVFKNPVNASFSCKPWYRHFRN